MELNQRLEGKNVRIVDADDEIFTGKVTDYIYPEDNEPEGIAGIAIKDCPQRPGQWIGFNETDIKSIEIISQDSYLDERKTNKIMKIDSEKRMLS